MNDDDQEDPDDLRAARGIITGVVIGLIVWLLIIAAYFLT